MGGHGATGAQQDADLWADEDDDEEEGGGEARGAGSTSGSGREGVLVVFIGGITFAEISAIRCGTRGILSVPLPRSFGGSKHPPVGSGCCPDSCRSTLWC